jgi:type I restriction enzyme S subunit
MQPKILDYFQVKSFEVASSTIAKDDIRFSADYFLSSDNIKYQSNVKFIELSKLARVIFPGIFKRIFVDNSQFGMPFITTSGMMEYSPEPEKYLSFLLTTNLNIYQVEEDWILVSRSGTIGNAVFTSNNLTKFAITEDALRVIPYDKHIVGFLYFYISSDYGKDLIVGKKGGAVVDHIYEEDLNKLKIPIILDSIISTLQQKYLEVKLLREEANDLLKEANKLVYDYNHLPAIDLADAKFYDTQREIQSRVLKSSFVSGGYRLDAHFYNPIAELAIRNIVSKTNHKELSDLSNDIIIGKRFKRNYVQSEFGIPFLSGKNIIQIKPTDLNYLSSSETGFMSELLVKHNWTLITCSGTLGRTCFVYKNYEDYAASQHILRVVPNEELIDPGYLYAFISSEYGFYQIVRYKYGAIIDEIDDNQIANILIAIPKDNQHQRIIGDKVRLAYEKRAEALRLEDEAQEILKQSLTG